MSDEPTAAPDSVPEVGVAGEAAQTVRPVRRGIGKLFEKEWWLNGWAAFEKPLGSKWKWFRRAVIALILLWEQACSADGG